MRWTDERRKRRQKKRGERARVRFIEKREAAREERGRERVCERDRGKSVCVCR